MSAALGASARTPANAEQSAQLARRLGTSPFIRQLALAIAAPLFVLCLAAAVSLGISAALHWACGALGGPMPAADWTDNWHLDVIRDATSWWMPVLLAILLVFALLTGFFVNINKFSLHGVYRNRLIRAYLGASRRNRCESPTYNPFAGFDPADNLSMYRLAWPDLTELAKAIKYRSTEMAITLGNTMPRTSALFARWAPKRRLSQDEWKTFVAELEDVLRNPGPTILNVLATSGIGSADQDEQSTRILWAACDRPKVDRPKVPRPLHVINMALNLVSGSRLAWQDRKAESFTATGLHCGSAELGYRSSWVYGGALNGCTCRPADAISLGTALTISGAAASPNMGYHSSPAVALLMTLFNVRLGAWLGNPGLAGGGSFGLPTYGKSSPRLASWTLAKEALGLTNDHYPYVYLSDGGHFENLGIYEMVRRRCRFIVACDAGHDPSCGFEDLGNAVRKVYIDMGVPIRLSKIMIKPRADACGAAPAAGAGRYCAVGTIQYSEVDSASGPSAGDGLLLYIKPALYEGIPVDVLSHSKAAKDFPHDTTADQFFSESQFESYRRLGEHVIEEITRDMYPRPQTIPHLIQAAEMYIRRKQP